MLCCRSVRSVNDSLYGCEHMDIVYKCTCPGNYQLPDRQSPQPRSKAQLHSDWLSMTPQTAEAHVHASRCLVGIPLLLLLTAAHDSMRHERDEECTMYHMCHGFCMEIAQSAARRCRPSVLTQRAAYAPARVLRAPHEACLPPGAALLQSPSARFASSSMRTCRPW